MEKQNIVALSYMPEWKKLREWVIEKVHRRIPEIREFVEENFDLKKEIVRNSICFGYFKSGLVYGGLTKGRPTNPFDVRKVLENYGYSFITDEKHRSPEEFREFSDGFRYKDDGKVFNEFMDLLNKKCFEIGEALVDADTSYIG